MDIISDLMDEIESLFWGNTDPFYQKFSISYGVDYVEIDTPYKDKHGDTITLIAYDYEGDHYYRLGNLETPIMDLKQKNPEIDSSELLDILKMAVADLSHVTWDGLEIMAEINHDDFEDLVAGMRSMAEATIKLDTLLRSKYPECYETNR